MTPLAKMARFEDLIGGAQPWPQAGQPEEVASVICFLAGDGASFITGEAVTVDGGLLAAGPRLGKMSDAGARGLVGVSRGTTGQETVVRRRLSPQE